MATRQPTQRRWARWWRRMSNCSFKEIKIRWNWKFLWALLLWMLREASGYLGGFGILSHVLDTLGCFGCFRILRKASGCFGYLMMLRDACVAFTSDSLSLPLSLSLSLLIFEPAKTVRAFERASNWFIIRINPVAIHFYDSVLAFCRMPVSARRRS